MSQPPSTIRGYRITLTVIGVLYVLMASSALASGPEFLLEFGVAPKLVADPVLQDFFYFFYQLMACLGVLTVVLGYVARERKTQLAAALVLCAMSLFFMVRDASTSDSALGNRLYQGEKTLVFIVISFVFALAFGFLAWRGRKSR